MRSAPPPHLRAQALARPGLSHGFFTRAGGVSTGIYDSLNCGPGSRDDPAAVAENRARVAAALGLPADALATVYQVHSAEVVAVDRPFAADSRPRADAMVTRRPGLALGILAADCVPVLFADADAGVIGAAHAGWKGALADVPGATVRAMQALGADPARIQAAIGPCIRQPSYEVGPDLVERFTAADPGFARFFAAAARPGHSQFDLAGFVRLRLAQAGVGAIEDLARDTRSEPATFFSYRRGTLAGEADYGRQISAIALNG